MSFLELFVIAVSVCLLLEKGVFIENMPMFLYLLLEYNKHSL